MAIRRETIGAQIKRIRQTRKTRDNATGMMINSTRELSVYRSKITLIGLFVSDENTFLIRPHVFESRKARNAKQWAAWMQDHYGEILRDNILPGMEVRTDKQWRLYRIIGWLPNDNTGLVRTKISRKRDKTKSQGRKNGRNRTRRR